VRHGLDHLVERLPVRLQALAQALDVPEGLLAFPLRVVQCLDERLHRVRGLVHGVVEIAHCCPSGRCG
jgi:hypothetical protein